MFSRKNHNDTSTNYGDTSNPNAIHSDPNASTHGTGSGHSEGGRAPHKSSLLNKLDPRVDSTTVHQSGGTGRSGHGALGASTGHENTGYGTTNIGHGGTAGYGRSTNAGPHSSNLANKVCPWLEITVLQPLG
jgi:hypothetical protein